MLWKVVYIKLSMVFILKHVLHCLQLEWNKLLFTLWLGSYLWYTCWVEKALVQSGFIHFTVLTIHLIGCSDLVDLWVIRIKAFARVVRRDHVNRARNADHAARTCEGCDCAIIKPGRNIFGEIHEVRKGMWAFFLDCTFRMLIGWAGKYVVKRVFQPPGKSWLNLSFLSACFYSSCFGERLIN